MAKYRKSFVERIKPTGFKDLLRRIVLLICVCVFCYSAYNLGSIFLEYKQIENLEKISEIKNTELIDKISKPQGKTNTGLIDEIGKIQQITNIKLENK